MSAEGFVVRTLKKLLLSIGLVAVILLVQLLSSTHSQASAVTPLDSSPAYATIQFGRSGWAEVNGCAPLPGSINLAQAVGWMSSQGVPAVGGVVTNWTQETSESCKNSNILYPSWQDLESLQSSYGFQAISQSADYSGWSNATTMTAIENESCNTLSVFQAHGFNSAWGMFAYPDNSATPQQEQLVAQCFAMGRIYGGKVNTAATASVPPYTVNTVSVTSGNCNDSTAACYSVIPGGKHYVLPSAMIPRLSPKAGQYSIMQFYRFVSGANSTGPVTWDCTDPNPAEHWVNTYEVYCYNDFQTIIQGRGAGVVFTDPATVATAWGDLPSSSR